MPKITKKRTKKAASKKTKVITKKGKKTIKTKKVTEKDTVDTSTTKPSVELKKVKISRKKKPKKILKKVDTQESKESKETMERTPEKKDVSQEKEEKKAEVVKKIEEKPDEKMNEKVDKKVEKKESKSPKKVQKMKSPKKIAVKLKDKTKSPPKKAKSSPKPTKSPSKTLKSPSKPSKKPKIDHSLYAPKKLPFLYTFSHHILPYYHYSPQNRLLLLLLTKSSQKSFLKHELTLLPLYTPLPITLTPSTLSSFPPSTFPYSYFSLSIIQPYIKSHFPALLDQILSLIKSPSSFSPSQRLLTIDRFWVYRLSPAKEVTVLGHLRKGKAEVHEAYDSKDKLDYWVTEKECGYLVKPDLRGKNTVAMVSGDKSEEKEMVEVYSNCRIDYRFAFEYKEKEDWLKRNEVRIRRFAIRGLSKEKCKALLEWNRLKVESFCIQPCYNNLDCFEKLSKTIVDTCRHLTIGYNFKDKPLNTPQGNKAAEGLRKTLAFLPNLESLTIWGYPVSTAMETLAKVQTKIKTVKVYSSRYRNFMFDTKPGEMHTKPGVFEYRNTSLLYRIEHTKGFFLYDD